MAPEVGRCPSLAAMVSSQDPVIAQVWRGGYVECLHHGSVVVTAPDGAVRFAAGDASVPLLPRSSLKPLQAVAMLRHGLDLDGAELALVGASHSGEPFHLDGVRRILDGAGLSTADLQTTPGLPSDAVAQAAWLAAGNGREPLAHNCSGKHAGMLRTCVRAGWLLESYLEADHPLQRACRDTIAELAGEPVGDPVVDGCGAPAFPLSLAGLSRAFGRLAGARSGPERRVAEAFRAHPEYASGTRRDEVVLHREVPGLVTKVGAEGCFAAGLPDGTGVAVKAGDGHHRAAVAALVAVLAALGHDTPALRDLQPEPVLGHGRRVGRVSVDPGLDAALRSGLG